MHSLDMSTRHACGRALGRVPSSVSPTQPVTKDTIRHRVPCVILAAAAPETTAPSSKDVKAQAKAQAKAAKKDSRAQAKAAGKPGSAASFTAATGDAPVTSAKGAHSNGVHTNGSSPSSVPTKGAPAAATAPPSATATASNASSSTSDTAASAPASSLSPAVEVAPDDDTYKGQKTTGIPSGIRLENISMTFKNQQVLKNCSWEVKKGERVGLVGVNGAGKTTQLQIIMGRLQPDTGEVIKSKRNMKIAFLAQEFDVDSTRTVREEFYTVYQQQLRVLARQDEISIEMESTGDDMDRMQELIEELTRLQSKALSLDVQLLDKKIDKMMIELGFTPEDNERLVASFSGGWQMRMCLGKILLQEPDLLLLDEPTNHLDIDAIQWLEGYLKTQEVPMVIVSHDREFLDQLCTRIVETERGVASSYPGNYTQYVAAKSEREALQWQSYEKQLKEIERQQDLIRRLSGGAQSGRASAAEKTLERIRAEGLVEKPFVPKQRAFTFPPVEKMGQKVVVIEDLTHGYDGRPLFRNADLVIEKGDRVAIIGPNGAGKSTLLRLIMGREKPMAGRVELGEHNIVPNYFEQNQAEALDLELSVLDTLVQSAPDAKLNELKALLGRMLFSGTAMEKKVKVLSGGEKARLALAKFMCTQGTLLVLDEPTNHLDIPSKETLEQAIKEFQGAVIAVSHDRYFLRKIATRVLLVEKCELVDFQGDYEYYLTQNESEAAKMEVKEEKLKEIEKDNIKAKSKMTRAEKELMKKTKAKEFHAKQVKK